MAFLEGVYKKAIEQMMTGLLDLADDDMRVLLVGSTHDSDLNDTTIGAFADLAEVSGTNYSTGGLALAGEAVVHQVAESRVEFDANDLVFTAVDGFTTEGAILYKFVTSLSLSLPVALIKSGGFPKTANGSDLTFQWNTEGILQGS